MYYLLYHLKSSRFVMLLVDVFHLTHAKRSLHLNSLKQRSLFWGRKRFSVSRELRIYVEFS
jgi:hypothetical protein